MTLDRAARIALEEAAARAWPPHETVPLNGWQMRFSGGGSQRANSVLTLHRHSDDIDADIAIVEHAYRARNLTPIFQITDACAPQNLGEILEKRGYTTVDRTLLMTKPVRPAPIPAISIARHPDPPPEWLEIYLSVITPDRQATAPAIIANLPKPRCFFVARRDGIPFAVGLGIAEGPYCGIECMATLQGARKSGGARAVLQALETWASEQAASLLWLQMLETNTPAKNLYESLGFKTIGSYSYRHAPNA